MSLTRKIGTALFLISSQLFATSAQAENPLVIMSTSMGDMTIELDEQRAPQSVRNFLAYANEGFYENTIFHRVIEGFMIQGGGFSAEYQRKTTKPPVSNEAYNGLRNQRYSIAMARTTAPHSATSQFFINSEDNRSLDHTDTTQRGWGYTVFGRVISGHEVVDQISRVRTSSGGPFSRDVPVEPVIIEFVRLLSPEDTEQANDPAAAIPAVKRQHSNPEPVKLKVNKDEAQIQAQPAEQN